MQSQGSLFDKVGNRGVQVRDQKTWKGHIAAIKGERVLKQMNAMTCRN